MCADTSIPGDGAECKRPNGVLSLMLILPADVSICNHEDRN